MSFNSDTLLSASQRFEPAQTPPNPSFHPFSSSSQATYSYLHNLINTADNLAHSLGVYNQTTWSNPKLVSLLRQHSSIARTVHSSQSNVSQILECLKDAGKNYGEAVPFDAISRVDWCVSRLETWGTAAGMETFKDHRAGGILLVLGGKVLVVDVDFSLSSADTPSPSIDVANVRISYASSNNSAGTTSDPAVSLDAFLLKAIRRFCLEIQKPGPDQDPKTASKHGKQIMEQLKYLVMLDRLAAREENGGLRWFIDIDRLCPMLDKVITMEANTVASNLSVTHPPLDIFLLRAHALPLPYLINPSVSFLVYLSPLAYLTLFRLPKANPTLAQTKPNIFDIDQQRLREYLTSSSAGAVFVSLSLTASAHPEASTESIEMPQLTTRPTFPLCQGAVEVEHVFPQLQDLLSSPQLNDDKPFHTWILDFTNGGTQKGVIMSQSRMRDIELVVNPLSGMDNMNSMNLMSYGSGSWIDMLLNPENPVAQERYTTIYNSPASIHPPLELRLSNTEEPGFLLERIPVHRMREVWGILEIVREQSWINGALLSCDWSVGHPAVQPVPNEEKPVTDAELQAVLDGTVTPQRIPVNVFLPSGGASTDSLFDSDDLDPIAMLSSQNRRPRIVMTSPQHPPISGLVEICVSYDETKPRGVAVEINGAIGVDIKSDVLEEICRRGGILGLSGRVWASHGT